MVNQPDATQAPLWTVGAPTQTTTRTATGQYVPGWQVPVTLVDGSGFTLEVSAADFTPDKVQAMIEDHVNRVTAIRALKGPTY